ncbi:hypothetical protein ACVWXB_000365 [Streptomyces sp. TE12347]
MYAKADSLPGGRHPVTGIVLAEAQVTIPRRR